MPLLPAPLIGRDAEIAAVCGFLRRAASGHAARLVTLTGPGGVVKTSLALAVAAALAQERTYRDSSAWRLAGAAAALLAAAGIPLARPEEGWIERELAPVRQRLPERDLDTLWAEGQAITLDAALAESRALDPSLRSCPARPPVSPAPGILSRRERQVAELVARGLTNRQIADQLFLSDRTIDSHVANILAKLALGNRVQLAAWVAAADE